MAATISSVAAQPIAQAISQRKCVALRSSSSLKLQHRHVRQLRQEARIQQRRPPPCTLSCVASAAAAADAGDAAWADSGSGAAAAEPARRSFPTWLAAIRATLFYLTTFAFAMPLFLVMLAAAPFVFLFDKYRRRAEHAINNVWAKLSTLFFYPIEIVGRENLPPKGQAAVFVANHLSFLDIYTLFWLDRDFKFISKTSNFLIPIIGWSMFLTGHVMINRIDRRSQLECLKACGQLLQRGASVLFFPEGTRSKDGRMYDFKKGAFSVAAKAKAPVVPVTLLGTGDLMPNKREYLLYPGRVKVVVHPPIEPGNPDEMMAEARRRIASGLPPQLVA